jgi:formylglycine-generating enzyme required for sulfatase activity
MRIPLPIPRIPGRVSATRATRTVTRLAAAVALLASATPALMQAQSINLLLGRDPATDTLRVVRPGDNVSIRFRAAVAGSNLSSLAGAFRWTPGALSSDSVVSATSPLVQTLGATTTTGGLSSRSASYFGTVGLTEGDNVVSTLWFTVPGTALGTNSYASTRLTYVPTSAASATAVSVLGHLAVYPINVCVISPSLDAKWGDVNNDGAVTIADAQQVARYSVGLSVANQAALEARGDVTNDGSVTITDAQQIARFTVALSASARVNTSTFSTPPTPTSLSLTGSSSTLAVGSTMALVPTATRTGTNPGDVTYCGVPFVYSTSNAGVASVDAATGVVTGVAAGTATITLGSGALTATYPVTVSAPVVLQLATNPGNGINSEYLTTQPVVHVRDANGALVTTPRNITATGTGVPSGTLTVAAVGGIATFTNLAIRGTGAHTLTFSSAGLSSVVSPSITIANASTMRLLVGQDPTQGGTAGTPAPIPLTLDLAGRGSNNLSSITTRLSWNPAQFTYVINSAGTWTDDASGAALVTVNTDSTAHGVLRITGFTIGATATSSNLILNTITLTPVATGPFVVNATILSAANANGDPVTVVPRNLGSSPTGGTVPVASVSLSPSTASLTVGGTQQLTPTTRDASSNVLTGRTVSYSSSNTAVATVSTSGLVTAVAAGSATITATSEGVNGTAAITVTAAGVPVASVSLSPSTASLTVGGTQQLTPTTRDASSNVLTGRTVSYSSSNTAVATVSTSGLVTAVAAGSATITATSEGVNGTAAITVTSSNPLGTGFGAEQFASVAAGSFSMGSLTGNDNERPVRTVTLTQAFLMQKTEVTLRQWQAVMGSSWTNPGAAGCSDLDCPVSGATYSEVQGFIAALNAMPGNSGMNYRLPTEAQWEYAARAGTTGDYGGTGVLDAMGWFSGNSGSRARTVAGKAANAFGLYDMHGNVDEWVSDWLAFYDPAATTDPTGPSTGTARILRGGSWGSSASNSRSAFRYWVGASDRPASGGFRLVRNP